MRRETLVAVRWTLLETLLRQALLIAFTVILARLLTPAQFGLVAMLGLFLGLAQSLTEAGLGAALVQADNPSQQDKSTVFWLQLCLGGFFGAVLAASGPLLAALFQERSLSLLALAFGINIFISAPSSVQISLAQKALNFRTPAIVSLTSQATAGCVATMAAIWGAGPWALVVQTLTASALTTVLFWSLLPWRPSLVFSLTSVRRLTRFGAFSSATGVLAEFENRIASLFLGRSYGPQELGQYQRASSAQLILVRMLSGVITGVAFPAFAAVQKEKARLISAIREATFVNFAVTAPVMWGVALVSEPLVRLAFGNAWGPSAPALAALCVAGSIYPIYAVAFKALRAIGKARLVFFIQLIRSLGMLLVVLMFAHEGFIALAWAQATFVVACLFLNILAVSWCIGFSSIEQTKDVWPIFAAGAVAMCLGLGLREYIHTIALNDFSIVLSLGATTAIAYATVLTALVSVWPTPASTLATRTLLKYIFRRSSSHDR